MFLVLTRFFENLVEWATTGRFPREELRIQGWIAALGGLVALALLVALLVGSVN